MTRLRSSSNLRYRKYRKGLSPYSADRAPEMENTHFAEVGIQPARHAHILLYLKLILVSDLGVRDLPPLSQMALGVKYPAPPCMYEIFLRSTCNPD
jgi:hypothetical protein